MKKSYCVLICFFLFVHCYGQKNVEGIWEGKLDVGATSLRLVFHLNKTGNGFTGTVDSPDQGAKGLELSKITINADSLIMEVASIGGKAAGIVVNDTLFKGSWIQGMSLPLQLKKVKEATTLKRPQTPKPPFSYLSEEVIYYNKDKNIQYGATLTMPRQKTGLLPALILITGSGQQNRDEELFGHKPFAVIADYLTQQGFVVLRVDDRGVGKTTGNIDSATSADFAKDVVAGIEYLKKRAEIDPKKIGLLGHSEGGMIAQIVSAQNTDVAFVISMAGPGQKIVDLMTDQNKALLAAANMPESARAAYSTLYSKITPAIVNAATNSAAKAAGEKIFMDWQKQTYPEIVKQTTNVDSDSTRAAFINVFVQTLRTPWFRYFMQYDPDPFIRKMKATKVLVLNGEKDIQVAAKPNLAGWESSLAKSRVKKYNMVELKGLNHLFQHCISCTVPEYGQLEETMAPEVLETIGNWLKENVK